ncbi:CPBP family intramembrane glutamic endopeptidase [Lewinella sp. IMCC34191]|uniref:CPBP family intramembrane glutamic endopeptidase n=1 Tax=Lewinella sp. IMCC34191 TaxID=2259172 RepID=UPI0013005B86|nr:CPBP family intramembrane glutamic endopeptidase [Lewinella sp. IMCC34191]
MVLLTSVALGLLARYFGLSLGDAGATMELASERMELRLILLINNLGTWGIPAILALWLTFRAKWTAAAGLVRPRRPKLIGNSILVFLFGIPLVALAAYLNLQLDLPEWMVQSEDEGNALLANVLRIESGKELLVALLTVAVVPAVAEELMFRGLLQGQLLRRVMSETAAIWAAAAIFSAIHLEFAGFFPRLLLGALLGYSYRWTGSLWLPLLLHFLFNGLQVINTYVAGEFVPDTEMDARLGTLLAAGAISLLIVLYLGYRNERQLRFAVPAQSDRR